MSLANDPRVSSITNRVKNLITKPEAEWDVIAGESATIQGLYKNYAMILAAIPAVIGFLAIVVRVPSAAGHALLAMIAGYILALIWLAVPLNFGARKSTIKASTAMPSNARM